MNKSIYDPELGIAAIEDSKSGIRVLTLCMEPGEKKAAIMAYVGARLSRSADDVFDIARNVIKKFGGEEAGERITKIVNGYGHASVADMSHNMIFVEKVPMVTAMRFFYLNPVQDGQERSTRFQNFSSPDFYIPESVISNPGLFEQYREILQKQIADYTALKDITRNVLKKQFTVDTSIIAEASALEARTFDTLRHLLPMGMRTTFCAIMSSRNWAKYIGLMRGSNQEVEQSLGSLLFELLIGNTELIEQGYVPESDALIRYAEPNTSVFKTIEELKELCAAEFKDETDINEDVLSVDPLEYLLDHINLLISGNGRDESVISDTLTRDLGRKIFSAHTDRNQLGNILQSGTIRIASILDIGALKDFNRHRSLERFIPFLENNAEVRSIMKNGFNLCDYLNHNTELQNLKEAYEKALSDTYSDIIKMQVAWDLSLEQVRYLLPHAHKSPYRMYGSLDDMLYVQNLRIRPGGHINYRRETYKWYEVMTHCPSLYLSNFWQRFQLEEPNPCSREEFINRS
jgi:thymidylate synthase ThyX